MHKSHLSAYACTLISDTYLVVQKPDLVHCRPGHALSRFPPCLAVFALMLQDPPLPPGEFRLRYLSKVNVLLFYLANVLVLVNLSGFLGFSIC